MSKQYDSLKFHWDIHKTDLRVLICLEADAILESKTYGRFVDGSICLNDELWEPFRGYPDYRNLIEWEGNSDDECHLMASIWIHVLLEADAERYLPIIRHLAETEVEGF